VTRTLLENAIDSIQLGVEDYEANDPRRAISATRNYFAGVLLLAKSALLAKAPNADPEIMLAASIEPVPDDAGGAKFRPSTSRTVDFSAVGRRLAAFGVKVDLKSLENLQRIRNDLEHSQNPHSDGAVREAIASSFPVVSDLCANLGTEPVALLGADTWQTMLAAQRMFEREHEQATATFANVIWIHDFAATIPLQCPDCNSGLIAQSQAANRDFASAAMICRGCGETHSAEAVMEHSLNRMLEYDAYRSVTKGDGTLPLHRCPECGVEAYVQTEDHVGCLWCGEVLGQCAVCHVELSPDNVMDDISGLCSYHANLALKDD
jgi:DNA-directed RNA polymerase subunit M/transcription elongation factor TFIIS